MLRAALGHREAEGFLEYTGNLGKSETQKKPYLKTRERVKGLFRNNFIMFVKVIYYCFL